MAKMMGLVVLKVNGLKIKDIIWARDSSWWKWLNVTLDPVV